MKKTKIHEDVGFTLRNLELKGKIIHNKSNILSLLNIFNVSGTNFINSLILMSHDYDPWLFVCLFSDEETEAQKNHVTCSRSFT